MVQSVVMIGAVMTIIMILLGFILLKASGKNPYLAYIPGMVVFPTGILLIVIATIAGKIEFFGAGLGGWGIALLFSSAIGFIITAIIDTYTSPVAN
ncbi:hypothetical protein KQI49_13575 [Virgibacillus sp. MSJ-26]|uniref:hypothetical protein n=1 Tax=Virgibacillus sp. MSJ-26 TaxID=2841522 RepID=UPI001C10AF26|nr:hypothetical protein [Virgibacillus sp. MSJ-26]MBU5467854.1 hypothetical protein [Virgibacillus sp. MSJ-26]